MWWNCVGKVFGLVVYSLLKFMFEIVGVVLFLII